MATPNPTTSFWPQVKAQVLAGLFLMVAGSIAGGVAYLIYIVPSRLDKVIDNQNEFKARVVETERITRSLEIRVRLLEASR
jgi:hypothetical protein